MNTNVLKVFEVTAEGFDGSSDQTDQLVFWVGATSADEVLTAIRDTGAKLCGQISDDCLPDVDFHLPGESMAFSSALLEKASEARNANRLICAPSDADVPQGSEMEAVYQSLKEAVLVSSRSGKSMGETTFSVQVKLAPMISACFDTQDVEKFDAMSPEERANELKTVFAGLATEWLNVLDGDVSSVVDEVKVIQSNC